MNRQYLAIIYASFAWVIGCQSTLSPTQSPTAEQPVEMSDTLLTFEEMGHWYGTKICNCGKSYFEYKEILFEIEALNLTPKEKAAKVAKVDTKYAKEQLKADFWQCRMSANDSLFINMDAFNEQLDYVQQQKFDAHVLDGFNQAGCHIYPKVIQKLFKN